MRRIHLLRVGGRPRDVAPLLAAARAQGLRIGWLLLSDLEGPAELEAAARSGASRAVSAGTARTVSVKHRQGLAVMGDLLREHFLGCQAVLVHGDVEAPLLAPAPAEAGWIVTHGSGREQRFTLEGLLVALRKPRPFTD